MGIILKIKQTNKMTDMYLADKASYDACLKDNGDKLVVIDFTATWCPPCKMIAPKYEAMAAEFDKVTLKKIDVDKNAEASQAAGIACMPTFKFYKDGKEVEADKIEGASEEKIRSTIKKYHDGG